MSITSEQKREKQWSTFADLSLFETAFYSICSIAYLTYICCRTFLAAPKIFKISAANYFANETDWNFKMSTDGWRWLGPAKDNRDLEWTILGFLLQQHLHLYVGHSVASAALRRAGVSHRARLTILTMGAVVGVCRVIGAPSVFSQMIFAIFALIVTRLTRRLFCVWMTTLSGLAILQYGHILLGSHWDPEKLFIWVITGTLTVNRAHSFCHEFLASEREGAGDQKTGIAQFGFLDLVNYVFYFPLFFYGPVMSYNQFVDDLERDYDGSRSISLRSLVWQLLRFAFWILFLECFLFRFYVNVAIGEPRILWRLDPWELAGVGFLAGQFFYAKYLVIYGLHGVLAAVDGMSTPSPPKCSARLYLTSDMLQNFDKGFYNFVKRYIYQPLGGSRRGVAHRVASVFCCFLYIFVWHGSQRYVLYWSLANFVGVVAESVGRAALRTDSAREWERRLGSRMWRRLRVLAALPFFCSLAIGMFMFFGMNEEVGTVYRQRFIDEGLFSGHFFVAIFAMFCQAQAAVTIYKFEETGKIADRVVSITFWSRVENIKME